jgi:hypothetical protein
MNDETVIEAVRDEIKSLPARRGDLEGVTARGRKRRNALRVGVSSVIAVATGMIVGLALASSPASGPVASDGRLQLTPGFEVPVFDVPAETEGALVYRARPGPDPTGIDTGRLGVEVVIDSRDPRALVVPISDHSPNALRADRIVYLGDLEDVQLTLHSFEGRACLHLGNGTEVTGGGVCFTEDGLAGGNYADPSVGSWLAWTLLPESASVVVGATADGSRYWQRVVGRTAVFILPDGTTVDPATLSALDANGNEVANMRGKAQDLASIGFGVGAECRRGGPLSADCG